VSLALPKPFVNVPAGPATLGIRPEHVSVQRDGSRGADLDLPVRLVEPLGKDTLLYFDLGSERPFVVVSEGLAMADMEAGAQVGLELARECLFLFGADGRRIAQGGGLAIVPARAQLAAARVGGAAD
jgi:multiple sugar transport system ATP-binding protein